MKPEESLYILGNCPVLGDRINPQKLTKKKNKTPINNKFLTKYFINFEIESTKSHIRYYYLIYNELSKTFTWEREPGHILFLDTIKNDQDGILKLRNDKYIKRDSKFISKFSLNKINDSIILGLKFIVIKF